MVTQSGTEWDLDLCHIYNIVTDAWDGTPLMFLRRNLKSDVETEWLGYEFLVRSLLECARSVRDATTFGETKCRPSNWKQLVSSSVTTRIYFKCRLDGVSLAVVPKFDICTCEILLLRNARLQLKTCTLHQQLCFMAAKSPKRQFCSDKIQLWSDKLMLNICSCWRLWLHGRSLFQPLADFADAKREGVF